MKKCQNKYQNISKSIEMYQNIPKYNKINQNISDYIEIYNKISKDIYIKYISKYIKIYRKVSKCIKNYRNIETNQNISYILKFKYPNKNQNIQNMYRNISKYMEKCEYVKKYILNIHI